MHHSTAGRLLVATPPLVDPNFDRTVVYMLEHNEDGALGVVLNRPTDQEHLPGLDAWLTASSAPSVVFSGGPVEPNALIGVAWAPGTEGDGWASRRNGIGTVDLSRDPLELQPLPQRSRIFRGYSGWGPGQLDDELEAGAWMVLNAERDDVFASAPQGLWRVVLRRQGGRLAWVADAPDDLSAN